MGMSARIQGVGNPADNAGGSSGWSSKIWGKGSGGDNLPNVPIAGGPTMPGGYGGQGQYGYPTDPNQGGYAGPQAPNTYGQQPPYQPEYPQSSFGGPNAPGAPAPYGGPSQYGGPPPPFNDQKFSGIGNPMYQDARGMTRCSPPIAIDLCVLTMYMFAVSCRREGFLSGPEGEGRFEVHQDGWTSRRWHERRPTWLDEPA